ncbi:Nucleotidyltransferase substrate binding protein, partial [Candidatus Omnitrophus magneticus]
RHSHMLRQHVYPPYLFLVCPEHSLIFDVDIWMSYHEARNFTSHTYDSVSAEKSL